MQKIMKNWIFTLIACILLVMFAVLLLLDNLGVLGERYIAYHFIHILTAVALAVYVILALCPMVPRYKGGSGRTFLLAEIAILAVTVVSQIGVAFFGDIPWLSDLEVCSVLGLALWLRTFVLIVRAYLLQGMPAPEATEKETDASVKPFARVPLWRLCVYILCASVGVWQMVQPTIRDKHFIYCIAAVTAVFATIFAVLTVQNQKEWRKTHPKKVKVNAPAELPAENTDTATAAVPAATEAPAVTAAKTEAPAPAAAAAKAEPPVTTAVVPAEAPAEATEKKLNKA